ncbi:hypothetical protein DYB37_005650 [Aphanomyces astaci]|uniref:Myb/SANT-like domain-containing protein n=1 Tax=Aphanomyces astaci TaxID=112090 RepID=A0A418F7U5_APHAT|nr:hypothetical protein DYB37_005650 [Aphanomyces astaci]
MGIWTDELDVTWLKELVYQVTVLGKKANSGYKKEAWTVVLSKLNRSHNVALKMSQLKSRHDIVKGMYGVLSKIVNSSGMGWESETCRVQCQATTWDAMLQGKPKSWAMWRNKRFPQFHLCERLFLGTLATGQYVVSSVAPMNSDSFQVDTVSGSDFDEVDHGDAAESGRDEDDDVDVAPTQGDLIRRSATGVERPTKRLRPSMASKLSNDFMAVQASATKELELLSEVLRPASTQHGLDQAKAIDVLQNDFADILDIDDMVAAFDIMENETRAAMFLRMTGAPREKWLQHHLQLTLRNALI